MYLALIPEEENTVIIKIDVQGFECKVSFMIIILGIFVLVLILERKLIGSNNHTNLQYEFYSFDISTY